MNPPYDGKLFTVDLILKLLGIEIKVVGTIEMLDIRRELT
jgi:hypothetical protein